LVSLAGLGWLISLALSAPPTLEPSTVSYRIPRVLQLDVHRNSNPVTTAGWSLERVQGTDAAGRAVIFELMVARDLAWIRGRTGVQRLSLKGGAELAVELAGSELAPTLGAARSVVVVGSASFDESSELAAQRAERMAAALPGARPVYRLDLGRSLSPCLQCETLERVAQRPILLLAVSAAHEGADLLPAVADALTRYAPSWAPHRYEQFRLK
jgi:hypothetical protein